MKACGCAATWVCTAFVLAVCAPRASALDVLIADDRFDGGLDFLETALAGHSILHVDNTDAADNPLRTVDVNFMAGFDAVIFYAFGSMGSREITSGEQTALEAYIQGGGNLIVTGFDTLGNPDDPRLADVVRSSTVGDDARADEWIALDVDHFILNGPFGDFRGRIIANGDSDHDNVTADTARGAITLGLLNGDPYEKIIFTDVAAPGGSVGMWNGNSDARDWDPASTDGDKGLAILRNWLAGLADADEDGVFDADDNCMDAPNSGQADADGDDVGDACDDCPGTAAGDPVDDDGCSTADDDADGVLNDQDDCPDTPRGSAADASGCSTGCCGASGPVAPLGLAVGMMLLTRLRGRSKTRSRKA